jgi:hypothetical protein
LTGFDESSASGPTAEAFSSGVEVVVDSIVVVTPVVVSVAESDEPLVATNANAITVVAIARTAMRRRS